MAVKWPGWRVVWSPAPPLPGRIAGPLSAYRSLAVCVVIVGVAGLAGALSTPASEAGRLRGPVAGASVLALASFTWFVLPRLPGWLVNLVAALAGLSVCHQAATTTDPQMLTLVPMLLAWLAVWDGYFLHPIAMTVQVVVLQAGYAAALLVNQQGMRWPGFVVVAVSLLGVAYAVNVATRGLRLGATHDPLTGCWNRAGLEMVAGPTLAGALRRGESVSVAMIDLDGFKQFNDARGHRAGDRLLHRAANQWRRQLRGQDILARVGGDEFVVVMPGVSYRQADLVLERLDRDPELRWSWGVTNWGSGEDLVAVLERADRELYLQKRGRARPGPGEGSLLA